MTSEMIAALITLVAGILGIATPIIYHWLETRRAYNLKNNIQLGRSSKRSAPQPTLPVNTVANICITSALIGLFTSGLFSIQAVVAGHISLKQIQASNNQLIGKRRTYTGIILGYLGIIVLISNMFAPPPMLLYPVHLIYPINPYFFW